jgi:hypothetical protein
LEFGLPALSRGLSPNANVQDIQVDIDQYGNVLGKNPVQPESLAGNPEAVAVHGIKGTSVDRVIDTLATQGTFARAAFEGFHSVIIPFHQSAGFWQDIVETAAEMFSHQGTPVSHGVANLLSRIDLSNSLIIAHSQGAAILNRAIEEVASNGITTQGLRVIIDGGAVNYAITELGITLEQKNAHAFDVVPNIVGGNAITSFRPWRIITSVLGIPFLETTHTYPNAAYPVTP